MALSLEEIEMAVKTKDEILDGLETVCAAMSEAGLEFAIFVRDKVSDEFLLVHSPGQADMFNIGASLLKNQELLRDLCKKFGVTT